MKKFLSFILSLVLMLSLCSGCQTNKNFKLSVDRKVKNVILVIGDGMGENHIKNTINYYGLENPEFLKDEQTRIATKCKDSVITDSAASATAMASGISANKHEVGKVDGKDVTLISELAKKKGKKVGIVTTDTLDGATPACFSAHATDRHMPEVIAQSQTKSNIDLFIGRQNENNFYYTDFKTKFEDEGYTFANDYEALNNSKNKDKIIATLDMPYSEYFGENVGGPQFDDLVKFAVEYLTCDEGYFLMVEGAFIDKFSHKNQLFEMMAEVRSLFDAVDYLYGRNDSETAILITADHETGRLDLAKDKDDYDRFLFNTTGHTSTDVQLFMKNVTMNKKVKESISNTCIFDICKYILKV